MQRDRRQEIYFAISEMTARRSRQSLETHDGLAPYEMRVFSQNGEDGVIAEVMRRIGITNRYFVEFGAEAGAEGNAAYLADVLGWAGLLMESNDESFARLELKYRHHPRVVTLHESVTRENVEALFSSAGVPEEPDVLSIDVDGNDYWIWEALTSYRPRLVVIAYNAQADPTRGRVGRSGVTRSG